MRTFQVTLITLLICLLVCLRVWEFGNIEVIPIASSPSGELPSWLLD